MKDSSPQKWELGDQTIEVSHPEKVYWPQTGYSKGEMLQYYQQIAGYMLPHLRDRPVTLRVYPKGISDASYYLRDCPDEAPGWLRRTPYQPKTVKHAVPLCGTCETQNKRMETAVMKFLSYLTESLCK